MGQVNKHQVCHEYGYARIIAVCHPQPSLDKRPGWSKRRDKNVSTAVLLQFHSKYENYNTQVIQRLYHVFLPVSVTSFVVRQVVLCLLRIPLGPIMGTFHLICR